MPELKILANWGDNTYTKTSNGPNMWTSNISVKLTPAPSETINAVWAIVTHTNGSSVQVNLSRTSGGGPGQEQTWQGVGFHSFEPVTATPRANIQLVLEGVTQNFT